MCECVFYLKKVNVFGAGEREPASQIGSLRYATHTTKLGEITCVYVYNYRQKVFMVFKPTHTRKRWLALSADENFPIRRQSLDSFPI